MKINELKNVFEHPENYTREVYNEAVLINEHMDLHLIKMTAQLMSLALAKARGRGKFGWWEPEMISQVDLVERALACLRSGDFAKVIVYAAMLMARKTI